MQKQHCTYTFVKIRNDTSDIRNCWFTGFFLTHINVKKERRIKDKKIRILVNGDGKI